MGTTAGTAGEILFRGGRVHVEPGAPPVEALLVRDGRVAAVGGAAVAGVAGGRGVRRIDLAGAVVTAGFTDVHVHLTLWGVRRAQLSVAGETSIEGVAARVAGALADGSGWVRGHGWSRSALSRDPCREDLDRVRPHDPVFLDSHDVHAAWLNGEALRRCGIGPDTEDPPGGRVVRDERGEPTGLLLENARAMALERLPRPTLVETREALRAAIAEAHRLGITGVHSVEATGLADFSALHAAGDLRLRVLQHLQRHQLPEAIDLGLRSGFGDEWLRIGGVKMFLDGALGSRTAWLRDPYEGEDADRGMRTLTDAEFAEAVRLAAENGLATAVHAIGDAAVELAVRTLAAHPPPPALPHRIEHLQLCPPDLQRAVARAGIVASMQPVHLLSDVPAAERHWGHARSAGAFPFAALERAGALLAFGSDVPVETIDPRPGLYAARCRGTWADFRQNALPREPWFPEHALSPERALAGYTTGPARAAGVDHRRGRLRPGYDADLVVWSDDPVTVDPSRYPAIAVLLTMVGGEVVFDELTS